MADIWGERPTEPVGCLNEAEMARRMVLYGEVHLIHECGRPTTHEKAIRDALARYEAGHGHG